MNDFRLPKTFQYNEKVHKLFRNNDIQIGDIFYPKNMYRGLGVFIVNQERKLEPIYTDGYGYALVDAWVLELYIKKGFTMTDVFESYDFESSNWIYFVCPLNIQGEESRSHIDKHGMITNIMITNDGKTITESESILQNDIQYLPSIFIDSKNYEQYIHVAIRKKSKKSPKQSPKISPKTSPIYPKESPKKSPMNSLNSKVCPPGKILNLKTGRCVNINGTTGKKIAQGH